MRQFRIDWNYMKNWPPVLWAIFFALCVFLIALVYTVFKLYLQLGILKWYLCLILVASIAFLYKAQGATDIHIHHYCIALAVMCLCCYQDIFITGVSGIFNGIFLEGVSDDFYAPIFYYKGDKYQKK